MKYLFLLFLAVTSHHCFAQTDEEAVKKVLTRQSEEWNRGSLEAFMTGYWNNDSLMFIGKSGVTYGYNATLQNYKKSYPDAAGMGKLRFTLLHLKPLDATHYFVVGKWHLTRSMGDLEGHFTLLFRKINGQWVIIADHSS